ncbi:hypothetical protein [Lactiplantibacillus pentosus]|uniref:hypothetical protein n=1 Tax=Lactiplantibacillus pentosus TaxID=1589 RepID=UPI0021A85295|nr:hypothetical protein [Lactiplantibacillus pentosus]
MLAIYPLAVRSGIDSDHFWELDFGELMVQIIANNRNRMDDMRMRAMMDHKQAEMMAFALNDPSKMPSVEEAYPFIKTATKSVAEPEWKQDQLLLMQQSQKIKTARKFKKTT